jgi:DNA-binding NarL/FixJ family response regulator
MAARPRLRLLLIDDHSLFRESLGRLLAAEPGLELAGSYSSMAEAAPAILKERIDVILLDFDLGEEQGLEAVARLRSMAFQGKVLMVTAGMRELDKVRAIQAGIAGIFLKHSQPAELISAIYHIARGEVWLDSRTLQAIAVSAAARADAPQQLTLNDRERTVLKAVFEGCTNKEISARMNISESYVKAILQQLFDKTGVRTRAQLVRVALEKRID